MSEEQRNQVTETELSEILQVRRDKLSALQSEGRDPFWQTHFARSHWTTEVKSLYDELEGKTVQVAGRIMSKRGMGRRSSATSRTARDSCSFTSAPIPSPRRSLRISVSMISAISSA